MVQIEYKTNFREQILGQTMRVITKSPIFVLDESSCSKYVMNNYKNMRKLLFVLLSLSIINELPAQNNDCADMPTLLENKVWKVQLPQDKQYTMEMELNNK